MVYAEGEITTGSPPNCLASELRQTSASAENISTGTFRLHPVHATTSHEEDALHMQHYTDDA